MADHSESRWVGRDTLLAGTRDEGGKMNSLLGWRHRCPRFHPAIYSSGRARSQSHHSISPLFKSSPISRELQAGNGIKERTVSKFDLRLNQNDVTIPFFLATTHSIPVSTSSSNTNTRGTTLSFGYIRFHRCEMDPTQPILHCLGGEIRD